MSTEEGGGIAEVKSKGKSRGGGGLDKSSLFADGSGTKSQVPSTKYRRPSTSTGGGRAWAGDGDGGMGAGTRGEQGKGTLAIPLSTRPCLTKNLVGAWWRCAITQAVTDFVGERSGGGGSDCERDWRALRTVSGRRHRAWEGPWGGHWRCQGARREERETERQTDRQAERRGRRGRWICK